MGCPIALFSMLHRLGPVPVRLRLTREFRCLIRSASWPWPRRRLRRRKDSTGPPVGIARHRSDRAPGRTAPSVRCTGPDGFTQTVGPASATLTGPRPRAPTPSPPPVSLGGAVYVPPPASQTVKSPPAAPPRRRVTYTATPGSLNLTVSGLPGAMNAAVTVTGPGGYSSSQTGQRGAQRPGPRQLHRCGRGRRQRRTMYDPSPLTQSVTVSSSAAASPSVAYVARTPPSR